MKRVTIGNISAETGISNAQISRALRGDYGVSEETRAEIILKAYEMGYDMSNIRQKKTAARRVGCVITKNDLSDEFFYLKLMYELARILSGLHAEFKLIIVGERSDEDELKLKLREEEVNMIITVGMVPGRLVALLSETGFPMIALDAPAEVLHVDRLCFNNYDGTYQITRYLISNGHENIVFAGEPELTYNFIERYRGYAECMKDCGLAASFVTFDISGALPDGTAMPTAFVSANDRIAVKLYDIISRQGKRIPEDVSVVGFDNIDLCERQTPPLTSVDFNPRTVAEAAVSMLMQRAESRSATTKRVVLDASIIIRQSVAQI